jgi:hypothetical protein
LTAGLIATLEAAAALGAVMPTTHDPTVTPEAAALTACVTVVEAVYVTAVWVVPLCTWRVPSATEAIRPETPLPAAG